MARRSPPPSKPAAPRLASPQLCRFPVKQMAFSERRVVGPGWQTRRSRNRDQALLDNAERSVTATLLAIGRPREGVSEQTSATAATVPESGSGPDTGVSLLPEHHRLVIVAYFLEDKTSSVIAEQMGVTEARVAQIRSEALVMLRDGIQAQFGEDKDGDPGEVLYILGHGASGAALPGIQDGVGP